jgi:hypothetical protein
MVAGDGFSVDDSIQSEGQIGKPAHPAHENGMQWFTGESSQCQNIIVVQGDSKRIGIGGDTQHQNYGEREKG